MKKSILSILTSLSLLVAVAQPAGETFPDFTYTDLEGQEHHLQSYLDQGKTVVIDVFATWCGVCQSSTGGMEELYNTYGQGGDGSLVLLTFERDPSTTNEAQFIEQYNVQSPVITEATDLIADEWNVTYQPRYFVICPDGTFNDEFISPVYNDPQQIVDVAEECATATGLEEGSLEEDFSIINTTVDDVLIYNSLSERLEYRIMDLTGSVSKSGLLEVGNARLDLSILPKGMYLIQVTDGSSALTKRIVKKS